MVNLIPSEFSNMYEINKRRIQRYVSIIKTQFYDMGLYHIEIVYCRSLKLYLCKIN